MRFRCNLPSQIFDPLSHKYREKQINKFLTKTIVTLNHPVLIWRDSYETQKNVQDRPPNIWVTIRSWKTMLVTT